MLLVAVASMFLAVLVHIVTLPVEWHASFRRALPLLQEGYLKPDDMPAARQILRAAAWTYVAASLSSLLNMARWIAILRRR
jgi:Zn-dependent membrane protease YugP